TSVGSFFFFQAEDGIRDRTVTGVQTCALPILFLMSAISESIILRYSAGKGRCHTGSPARSAAARTCSTHASSPMSPATFSPSAKIGRASCRERVQVRGGGVTLKATKDKGSIET